MIWEKVIQNPWQGKRKSCGCFTPDFLFVNNDVKFHELNINFVLIDVIC